MANSLIVGYGIFFCLVIIIIGVMYFAEVLKLRKLARILNCTCGKFAALYSNENGKNDSTEYCYMCACNQRGFIAPNKELAMMGWKLRNNPDLFALYLVADNKKKTIYKELLMKGR